MLRSTVAATAHVADDLLATLLAHRPAKTSARGRAVAARQGLAAAVMLRRLRAQETQDAVGPGNPRRTRLLAAGAAVILVVLATALAAAVARHVGPSALQLGQSCVACMWDSIGGWWDALPAGEKLGVLVAVGAIAGLLTGGLGTAFMVSGVAGYGLSHAHGLATLSRDPRAAVRGYLREVTPQGAALDAAELALTFLPVGAGASAGRAAKSAASEFARDPDAFLALRRAAVARGEAGTVRFDAVTGLKRPSTWREVIADWRAGRQFNVDQWHRFEANEITLANGKRLDSYTRGRLIVSRKHSQLADLEPSTVASYLRELAQKYPRGAEIKDTAWARTHFPQLIGTELRGRHVLEVPVQSRPVPDEILSLARRAGVTIQDVTGTIYR